MPLNILEPTKVKERLLRKAYAVFFNIVKEALGFVGDVRSRAELHEETYDAFRGKLNADTKRTETGWQASTSPSPRLQK